MTSEPKHPRERERERDDVATLIRLGGRRPAVPAERLARSREAARARWREAVRERSRGRRILVAGLVTAAALVIALAARRLVVEPPVPPAADARIRVEALVGEVWIRTAGDQQDTAPRALGIGDDVALGSEIVTGAEGGTAILLASGHSVRLDASTRLRLLDSESIALDQGALYVDSGFQERPAGSISVRTRFGAIEEVGTQFEVRLAGETLHVRLREGEVVVSHDGRSHAVAAGRELELRSDGSTTTYEIATHGDGWDWINRVTPMLDLEGRTAREFLTWIGRERGLQLVFADEAVARAADETVLGGTAGGLSVDDALDAVLPTCRMVHRIEDGRLTIYLQPQDG